MARSSRKLTDRAVRGEKAEGYHSDGDGLYLVVAKTGARSWVYRYRHSKGRTDLGLGSLLQVSLVEARDLRDVAKRTLAAGGDPRSTRTPVRAKSGSQPAQSRADQSTGTPLDGDHRQELTRPSLLDVWKAYVEGQEGGWRGRKTRAGWMRSIESHAADIKDKPVDLVDLADVLSVVKPIWLTKAESACKLRERLERVLDYAKVMKHRTGENPAVWKGNLVHLLPPRPKLQRGHMPAMAYEDIPAFMVRLARSKGMSARALEFTILTVSRETMTLEATWGEMHDDLWVLDELRMKERAFRQPLSRGAAGVLDAIRPSEPRRNQLVFPAQRGGVMSNMAMDMLLRDLAPGCTPHGMRSAFRDWAGDETDYAREVIEACLAHVVGDDTERAYRRSDALRKRRDVLEAWSTYCLGELTTKQETESSRERMNRAATGVRSAI